MSHTRYAVFGFAYPSESASRVAFERADRRAIRSLEVSLYRLTQDPERQQWFLFAVCPIEELAAVQTKLDWGGGVPVEVTEDVAFALVARRLALIPHGESRLHYPRGAYLTACGEMVVDVGGDS